MTPRHELLIFMDTLLGYNQIKMILENKKFTSAEGSLTIKLFPLD